MAIKCFRRSLDGLGRRITRTVKNSADLDRTDHYYYNQQSIVEIRNGSDKAIQQLVWGLGYIDELVQVSHNLAPTLSHNNCTRHFYAMQDATPGPRSPSFAIGRAENVMGLVEESGRLVERYEYTPYGRRQVFAQPWYRADFDRDGDGRR